MRRRHATILAGVLAALGLPMSGAPAAARAFEPGVPPNDECIDAIDIATGNTAIDTNDATNSGPELPLICEEGFGVSFVKDVWYRFTPTGDGTLTVTTCNGANFDTRLAAYIGLCNELTLVACNDDSPLCIADRSLIQLPVLDGIPVLIRVGGFDAGGIGTLTLTSDIPPPNDECADSVDLAAGTHAVTTINATTGGPELPSICNEGTGLTFVNDVWFTHKPDCTGTLTVSTCNTAIIDTRLAAYSGACDELTLLACNDDAAGCLFHTSTMSLPVTSGEAVVLRVGAVNGSGNMLVTITCAPPPPPCPADIDDSGEVNINDLLEVINGWGPCPAPPDPCAADIEPIGPPQGDGTVDINDLLLVINSWGPCE